MYVHPPPDYREILVGLDPEAVTRAIMEGKDPADYPHWDKLRHLEPPAGLTLEEWWMAIKLRRVAAQRFLPLEDPAGTPFSFSLPDLLLKQLHFVDQRCSGEIATEEVVMADDQARRHYLMNSLMEEAIRSSQLEGATTSRQVAKELLQSGREPANRSERMIVNNYQALQFMREGIGDRLTPRLVLELQRILTDGTLDNPDAAGRLQRPDEERVAVYDRNDGSLLHTPPPAEQLPERLKALCDFANSRSESEHFIHPVVRGLILHFWIGYDHPFEDGNGRTARALFYWYMRVHGYWLVEYLSISRILRQAPSQYSRAFLLTETDEQDTTYFLLYQLEVVERAVKELHRYLRRKVTEVREVEQLLRDSDGFNHRQLALLGHALRNDSQVYTFSSHARTHGVTHETARTDLGALADRGLLTRQKVGRGYRFRAPQDLAAKLRSIT